jgi:hypothetical protein
MNGKAVGFVGGGRVARIILGGLRNCNARESNSNGPVSNSRPAHTDAKDAMDYPLHT